MVDGASMHQVRATMLHFIAQNFLLFWHLHKADYCHDAQFMFYVVDSVFMYDDVLGAKKCHIYIEIHHQELLIGMLICRS